MQGRFVSNNLILAQINKKKQLCLIDTGATISAISQKFAQKLNLDIKPAPQTHLLAADNQVLPTLGTVEMSVKINGLIIPFDFTVIPSLCNEVIFGLDFLNHTQAVVKVSAQLVSFYDELIVVSLLNHFSSCHNIARIDRNYVIPSNSETLITVKLPTVAYAVNTTSTSSDAILIESLPVQDKILVARSLAKVSDKIAVIKVLNCTKKSIKLRKTQAIAQIAKINLDDAIHLPPPTVLQNPKPDNNVSKTPVPRQTLNCIRPTHVLTYVIIATSTCN